MHKIDVSKGSLVGTVSSQWFGRPDDQRFTSLNELRAKVAGWAEASHMVEVAPRLLRAEAATGNRLSIIHDGDAQLHVEPTNYGFGAIAREAGAPAAYLRKLPADLAAACLNNGFKYADKDRMLGAYAMTDKGMDKLRALTSTSYGRILDRDVVDAVQKVAGNGIGDTRWKVPGTIDWTAAHGVHYNPQVDITKDNTTLYASDRDLFLFLVDDMNPIEVGKLSDGSPDLMFRGFYVWNSEVGDKTFGVATMYLRGVCQNRNLWGVEGFSETSFRHTAGAPDKFAGVAAPALASYAEAATGNLIEGVKKAKSAIVTPGDSPDAKVERIAFLMKLGFSKRKAEDMVLTAIVEEGRPPESVWDHAQAITASARSISYQEDRVKVEAIAGKLLDKVAA